LAVDRGSVKKKTAAGQMCCKHLCSSCTDNVSLLLVEQFSFQQWWITSGWDREQPDNDDEENGDLILRCHGHFASAGRSENAASNFVDE